MKERTRFHKPICIFIIICFVVSVLFLQPMGQQEASAGFFDVVGCIANVISAGIGIAGFICDRIEAGKKEEELKKIQGQLDGQKKMLEQMESELSDLRKTLAILAKNLEIDFKEMERYEEQLGAQEGIDNINAAYDELHDILSNPEYDVSKMHGKPEEVQALKDAIDRWSQKVDGAAYDIRVAETKINSAIRPDIPETEGLLELWTDEAILRMPKPNSAANDFSVKAECMTPSGEGEEMLPILGERPMYFNYLGLNGGSIATGEKQPSVRWYFAEGTCRPVFHPFICINNPEGFPAAIEITYMRGDASVVKQNLEVPAQSRSTVVVKDLLGSGDSAEYDFSCVVNSTNDVPVVAEIVQYYDYQEKWLGGGTVPSATSPTAESYLAEGTCRPNFETYITIMNPGETDTTARLTYMKGDGTTTEQLVGAPAHSRITVRPSDILGVADDAAHDFSTKVESLSGAGLVVERPMYFYYGGVSQGGHCSLAAPAPSAAFYLAEGTLRPGFDTYLTILNPNEEPVDVRFTYMWGDGRVSTEELRFPATSRGTVRVKDSSAAKTVKSYYESLKEYFNNFLYYQNKGMTQIAEHYNGELGPKENPPAPMTLGYIHGTYKDLIEAELEEFMSCVESLVVSWSYIWTPNGLVPEASDIFADADFLCTSIKNSLLQGETGAGEHLYGAFGRAFGSQSEFQAEGAPGLLLTGSATAAQNLAAPDVTWRPVRLKYYDEKQGKVITDTSSVGVARYHQNCEKGDYKAVLRGGLMVAGGTTPTLGNVSTFEVQDRHLEGGEGTAPLAFGNFTVLYQPQRGYPAQSGEMKTEQGMTGFLRSRRPLCSSITAGGDFCAYLQPGTTPGWGSIRGWGDNSHDQLKFPGGDDYVQIAAGYSHGLALKSDGSIVGWGDNELGQTNCPAGNDFVQVAGGMHHSLALKSDGSIVGWGGNGSGQISCPAGNDFVQVAAGDYHSLALKSDGSIVGWGDNQYGQISCPAGKDSVKVAAGCDAEHSLALKRDGSIAAWGRNDYGQTVVPKTLGNIDIAAGGTTSLYVCGPALLRGWGGGAYGQTSCPPGKDFVQVAAGRYHSLALKSDRSIVGWGSNAYGQKFCPPGNDFVQVAGGELHSLALKSDRSIVGWGLNDEGETSCPPGKDFVQVAGGWRFSLALKSDRSLVGWGQKEVGQTSCPPGNDFVQVAAGESHGLALKQSALLPWIWR